MTTTPTDLDNLDHLLEEYASAHVEYWTSEDDSPFEADAKKRREGAAAAIREQLASVENELAKTRAELAIAQREWKAWEQLANKAAQERNALRAKYEPTPAGTADAEAANPATTAEPADEPQTPNRTCGFAFVGNLGEFTCDHYAGHQGKHRNYLAEFEWADEPAAS